MMVPHAVSDARISILMDKSMQKILRSTSESPTSKASNGWLEKWKLQRTIRHMRVSGESGKVKGATVDSLKEHIPDIIAGAENIWKVDETGCFWRAFPGKGLGQKGKILMWKGGKKCKQRVIVSLFVNASGRKEGKPIVIWTSENPQCFKKSTQLLYQ